MWYVLDKRVLQFHWWWKYFQQVHGQRCKLGYASSWLVALSMKVQNRLPESVHLESESIGLQSSTFSYSQNLSTTLCPFSVFYHSLAKYKPENATSWVTINKKNTDWRNVSKNGQGVHFCVSITPNNRISPALQSCNTLLIESPNRLKVSVVFYIPWFWSWYSYLNTNQKVIFRNTSPFSIYPKRLG